jgi:hypothetical protein
VNSIVDRSGESGRCEDAVEPQCERLSFARREERFEIHHADAIERRPQDLFDQSRQVGLAVAVSQQSGHQCVLAAVWSGIVDAGKREQAGRHRSRARCCIFRVVSTDA